MKSQIEAMTGQVIHHPSQSDLARMIEGDLKGGEKKHDYIMSVIARAIEQAFKGNARDIPEAADLCTGRSVKARAYHAGFHAIADMVTPITYTGKLTGAHNASVREDIANKARYAASEFEKAYLMTFVDAKAERLDKKLEKAHKASTVPAAPEASLVPATLPMDVTVDDGKDVVVDIATTVEAVVQAMSLGLLTDCEMDSIAVALRQYSAAKVAAVSSQAAIVGPRPTDMPGDAERRAEIDAGQKALNAGRTAFWSDEAVEAAEAALTAETATA